MDGFWAALIITFSLIGGFIYLEQEVSIEEYKSLNYRVSITDCPSVIEYYNDILSEEGKIDNNDYFTIENKLDKCEKETFVKSITNS